MECLEIRLIKTFEDEECIGVAQFRDKVIVATDRRVYELINAEFDEIKFVPKHKGETE